MARSHRWRMSWATWLIQEERTYVQNIIVKIPDQEKTRNALSTTDETQQTMRWPLSAQASARCCNCNNMFIPSSLCWKKWILLKIRTRGFFLLRAERRATFSSLLSAIRVIKAKAQFIDEFIVMIGLQASNRGCIAPRSMSSAGPPKNTVGQTVAKVYLS